MTQSERERRPHVHKFTLPSFRSGPFDVFSNAGLCKCGAWRNVGAREFRALMARPR